MLVVAVTMLSPQYTDGSLPQQQKLQYTYSLFHWNKPLQKPLKQFRHTNLPEITNRGRQRAARGLMHPQTHTDEGREGWGLWLVHAGGAEARSLVKSSLQDALK